MRLLLDANVLLDCLVTEAGGQPRAGAVASSRVFEKCDAGEHGGLVAWQTLCILAYYHQRQNDAKKTGQMMDDLLAVLEVPTVGHADAARWRSCGPADFEDALQVASAIAGNADAILTRNGADFTGSPIPAMTPEDFLAAHP